MQDRTILSIAMHTSTHSKDAYLAPRCQSRMAISCFSLASACANCATDAGMTRKMMAQEADVSERHLAQLEAGEGNVSIVLLRRIAAALHVSLAELFAPEAERQHEKTIDPAISRAPSSSSRGRCGVPADARIRKRRESAANAHGADWIARSRQIDPGIAPGEEMKIPFIELDQRN